MRVVVSGATGFVGRGLVQKLLLRGHEVTVLSRSIERAKKVLALPCRYSPWTDESVEPDPSAFDGADAVIHLAGASIAEGRWSARRKKILWRSRIDSTRQIVSLLRKMSRPPSVFVCSSAVGIYGDRGDEPLSESSLPGEGFLSELCIAWEKESLRGDLPSTRCVALRAGVVLGRGGGMVQKLIPIFRKGLGARLGTGKQWLSWIHLEDLHRLIEHCLNSPEIRGPIDAVAPAPVTNREFTEVFAECLGVRTFVPVPAFALKTLLGEKAAIVLASQRVAPEKAIASGFNFQFPLLSTALSEVLEPYRNGGEILERSQWVPRPPQDLFSYFSDAQNLEELTPPWLGFKVDSVSSPKVGEGTEITYRLSIHGIRVRWRSRIEEWRENNAFVDIQLRGPYAQWHHTHEFVPLQGGTLMTDRVLYRLPLGRVGRAVAHWKVRRDVDQIFDYRRIQIADRFGA